MLLKLTERCEIMGSRASPMAKDLARERIEATATPSQPFRGLARWYKEREEQKCVPPLPLPPPHPSLPCTHPPAQPHSAHGGVCGRWAWQEVARLVRDGSLRIGRLGDGCPLRWFCRCATPSLPLFSLSLFSLAHRQNHPRSLSSLWLAIYDRCVAVGAKQHVNVPWLVPKGVDPNTRAGQSVQRVHLCGVPLVVEIVSLRDGLPLMDIVSLCDFQVF